MNNELNFARIAEAHEHLSKKGYQTIDNVFWYLPETNKWAVVIDQKENILVRKFQNAKTKGSAKRALEMC